MRYIIGLVIGGVILIVSACATTETIEASLPDGFTRVTFDDIDDYTEATVLRHKETGCYYTWIEGYKSGGLTQMFVEKNGVSIPYCDR